MSTTNITEEHKKAFQALISGEYSNLALFSCFLDGEPAAAIVAFNQQAPGGDVSITPLFVSVTPRMKLADHDGRAPGND